MRMIVGDAKLEAMIHENPADEARWLVCADALLTAGDTRGEIIAMGAAGRHEEVARLLEIHEDELWGAAKYVAEGEPFAGAMWTGGWEGAAPQPIEATVRFELSRFGMIDTVSVDGLDEEGHVARALGSMLSCPLGRFVRLVKLEVGEQLFGTSGSPNYDMVFASMARARPGGLRCLEVKTGGYQLSWTNTGNMGPLLAVTRHLEELDIEHGRIALGDALDLPGLRSLSLESGGLPASTVEAIASASWPSLERLVVFFGCREYGGDAEPQ